jgi:hypothetical protein
MDQYVAQTSSGIKICWRLQSMRPSGEQYKTCSPRKKRINPSTILPPLLRGAPGLPNAERSKLRRQAGLDRGSRVGGIFDALMCATNDGLINRSTTERVGLGRRQLC